MGLSTLRTHHAQNLTSSKMNLTRKGIDFARLDKTRRLKPRTASNPTQKTILRAASKRHIKPPTLPMDNTALHQVVKPGNHSHLHIHGGPANPPSKPISLRSPTRCLPAGTLTVFYDLHMIMSLCLVQCVVTDHWSVCPKGRPMQ
jgi:hypothetical protein